MKQTLFKRLTALLLCALMAIGEIALLSSCGNAGDEKDTSAGESSTNAETEELDPFAGVNYNGREFRIYTSTNVASYGMGNSNALIQGSDKTDGNAVNDAVFERNMLVEDKLGVKLVFTQLDVDYNAVFDSIRKLTSSGLDEFDLVINDLFPFANLSIEGNFRNILSDECQFDFDKNYWYKDFMDDLRLMDGYEYLLAGDYFIDIIRSAHLLLFNKDMYEEHYHTDPNEVYEWVKNYQWTYDKLNEMITGFYSDLNFSNTKDYGDQYGYAMLEFWGSSIGLVVSASPNFITRDEDGVPTIAVTEGTRASDLVEKLTALAHNEAFSEGLSNDQKILKDFTEGLSLICDYQRLGSLENIVLRDMQQEMGVLPNPMLYAEDRKYTTAAHDTTELGAILSTSTDLEFISTVIEVLNRETANVLIPKYYKEALQIQYVNDPYASEMVQIIHDNFGNAFVLAYNNVTGSHVLNVFSEAVKANRTFAAAYKSYEKSTKRALETAVKNFRKKNQVE